jgi:hypothetical protein
MAAGGRPASASDWSGPAGAAEPTNQRPGPHVLAWAPGWRAGGERSVQLTSGPRPGRRTRAQCWQCALNSSYGNRQSWNVRMKRMKHIHWYSLVMLSWYQGQIVKRPPVLTETVVGQGGRVQGAQGR